MKKSLYLQKFKGLLFDHLSTKQIIAKNTFWLFAAEFLGRFLKFFLVVFTARILGVTDYGKLSFALAFAMFFTVFSDLGISTIVIREFSRDRSQERWFPALISLKIILSLVVTALIVALSFFVTSDPSTRTAIWIFALCIFSYGITTIFHSFFNARQRMEYGSFLSIVESALLVGVAFFVLFTFPSIESVSWAYAVSALVALILTLFLFRIKIAPLRLSINPAIWKKFLWMAFPVGLVGFLSGVFNGVDSITLGIFGQITQVGWYNAAYSIFNAIFLPAAVIVRVFTPVLSRAFKESANQLQKVYNFQMEIMVFLAFGFLSGGLALSSKIIDFMYDPSYFPAVFALNFLLPAAVFFFLSYVPNLLLISCDRQREVFIGTLLAVATNVILNLVLIPRFSLYGTALATFTASAVMFFMLFYFVRTLTPVRFLTPSFIVSLLSAGVAGVFTYLFLSIPQIAQLHVLTAVMVGGTMYLLMFAAFRFFVSKLFQNKSRHATKDV